MSLIRVKFRVHCLKGEYNLDVPYDIEETDEVRALIRRGLLVHVPFPDNA